MYNTNTIILHDKDYIKYSKDNCILAKQFKNCCIFVIRQLLSSKFKDYKNLSKNEQKVINNFKLLGVDVSKFWIPTYETLDKYFKATKNADYYNALPMQSTEDLISETIEIFDSYFALLKMYKENPNSLSGRPKMPDYIKTMTTVTVSNQDAVWYTDGLKMPKIKKRLDIGNLELGKIKEVKIVPYYDTFKICIASEGNAKPKPVKKNNIKKVKTKKKHISKIKSLKKEKLNPKRILGVDFGIDNFLTISNNCGLNPLIINGKGIKSYNQYYNKLKAYYQSLLQEGQFTSRRLQKLSKNRDLYLKDKYEQISSYLVCYAYENKIGTIVLGKNDNWKQNINIGKTNNQNFTFIGHAKLIEKIKYKTKLLGINVVIVEESYTSKASFLDNDKIPVYGEDDANIKFSGTRIKRGLYKSKKGILINADVNGASNIIRKYDNNAFKNKRLSYLTKAVEKINI